MSGEGFRPGLRPRGGTLRTMLLILMTISAILLREAKALQHSWRVWRCLAAGRLRGRCGEGLLFRRGRCRRDQPERRAWPVFTVSVRMLKQLKDFMVLAQESVE